MIWSKEHDQRLRDLLLDGLSSQQIATRMNSQFGLRLTRSAVIGRRHRLGLKPGGRVPSAATLNGRAHRRTQPWTSEHDQFVREKRAAAWPDQEIALALCEKGFLVHREAVRNRAEVLGLPRVRRSDMPTRPRAVASNPTQASDTQIAAISRAEAWLPIPESRRVRIDEMRRGMCHWPLWDGPTGGDYCGADTGDVTRSYCRAHQQLSMRKEKVAA